MNSNIDMVVGLFVTAVTLAVVEVVALGAEVGVSVVVIVVAVVLVVMVVTASILAWQHTTFTGLLLRNSKEVPTTRKPYHSLSTNMIVTHLKFRNSNPVE